MSDDVDIQRSSEIAAIDAVRDGLMRNGVRRMVVLLIAAPAVGVATFVVVRGATFVLPAIVMAMPLLLMVRDALKLRNLDKHPLVAALRDEPRLIKKVDSDVRPLGVIKWSLAESHMIQVRLAGDDNRYSLAYRDKDRMKAALALFRARAVRAVIDGAQPAPEGENLDAPGAPAPEPEKKKDTASAARKRRRKRKS